MKYVFWLVGLGVAISLIAALIFQQEIKRLRYQTTLFSGAPQHEHFVRQDDYYPFNEMSRAPHPQPLTRGAEFKLPTAFVHLGEKFITREFLEHTDTTALLVLHNGQLLVEEYWLTGGPDVAWLTHSVSKTMVATAVGIALRDGLINDLDDPVTAYVAALRGSGYDGVSIRDILQMSSGVKWNEDYADPDSDLNLFGGVMIAGASYDEFVAGIERERQPGTFNSYVGMNSQALTMLVRAVTGMSLAQYLTDELWHPLGMQDRAYWTTDRHGVELGLGGLSASARDLAKLGELYRQGGIWQGRRILDAQWVREATTVTAPHLARGENPDSAHIMGYGFHWWLPDGDASDYSAIGIYNQFVYVDPEAAAVIVKLSAYRRYASSHAADAYLEAETFSLFRAIGSRLPAPF